MVVRSDVLSEKRGGVRALTTAQINDHYRYR